MTRALCTATMKNVRSYLESIPLSLTLYDVDLTPAPSDVHPADVDLSTTIGHAHMNIPIMSPPMDTVTGPALGKALAAMGGCGVLYRHPDPHQQMQWLTEVLEYKPCIVREPASLRDTSSIEEAGRILKVNGFSTIPVTDDAGRLAGVLFTKDVAFKWHREDPVSKWMVPLERLKVETVGTSWTRIRERLLHEQECSVLPIIDAERRLQGIYFMKDVVHANPSTHIGTVPLVGMAIGVHESDVERVKALMTAGTSAVIVIDSSHGDCAAVIEQTRRVRRLSESGWLTTIIAGNVADIDGGGYRRLAEAGADAVKVGIGSGSICTTTMVTGAGVGMVTAIRACIEARRSMAGTSKAPAIIADGGINGPGDAVKALLVGADAVMAGKWLVAASESHSAVTRGIAPDGRIAYRGMASREAVIERLSDRYGKKKMAPEGVAGFVLNRGPLLSWLPEDLELMRGGFAHAGARNLRELHARGEDPSSLNRYSSVGRQQGAIRVDM